MTPISLLRVTLILFIAFSLVKNVNAALIIIRGPITAPRQYYAPNWKVIHTSEERWNWFNHGIILRKFWLHQQTWEGSRSHCAQSLWVNLGVSSNHPMEKLPVFWKGSEINEQMDVWVPGEAPSICKTTWENTMVIRIDHCQIRAFCKVLLECNTSFCTNPILYSLYILNCALRISCISRSCLVQWTLSAGRESIPLNLNLYL